MDKALSRLDYNIIVFCIPAVILYVVGAFGPAQDLWISIYYTIP
jgi:hypothetical protein